MKFICLGYIAENKLDSFSESERLSAIDECMAFDDTLREAGHFIGGEGLQGPRTASTLPYVNGKVTATDGPYAETKEQLGGILILEANDLEHAKDLMSNHPGIRLCGPFEIRPVADITEMVESSRQRRRKNR